MKFKIAFFIVAFPLALRPGVSSAEVLLFARGGAQEWQAKMSGFLEFDYVRDSRFSFLETAGNYPIVGRDSPGGQGERREISLRNSRLAFSILPPGQETWKPKIYAELDWLGNRLSRPFAGSRATYYTDPSLRIRHFYFSVEHEGWQYLLGQYWGLFGWQPAYFVTTASVAPGPGVIHQRTPQVTVIRHLVSEDQTHRLSFGLSLARASQKAGGVPNMDAGVRYSGGPWKSGFTSATGEPAAEPLSLALSGTMRKFASGSTNALSDDMKRTNAYAFAFDLMAPLIPSSDGKDVSGTLTLSAEYSVGTGYGDVFPGWSGNLPEFPYSATPPSSRDTHLGKGYGGYDSDGDFRPFRLQSWNVQIQYHFPRPLRSFATLGHSELLSFNVGTVGPVPDGYVAYDRVTMDFVNLFHDFSRSIRGAVECAHFTTRYVNTATLSDDRYQVTAYYRF